MNFFFKQKLHLWHDPFIEIERNPVVESKFGTLYLAGDKNSEREITYSTGRALFIGDPVFHKGSFSDTQQDLIDGNVGKTIRGIDGFYYMALINEAERKLMISGSIFSILPVFYQSAGDELYMSSSLTILREQTKHLTQTQDHQYYIEKAIFNYALFDRTPVSEIKTVPSNCYLEITETGWSLKKHTFIHDYFVSDPASWRKSLNSLSDFFIENAKPFLPGEKFTASLTGGFDSRTVVSLALAAGKEFDTYSYGSAADPDVSIPRQISAVIGRNFEPVILGRDYAEKHFLKNALQFLIKSHGTGNISRAHYHYALATRLSNTRYLLTGNFGSEILRSMKIPGVMTSEPLFTMFSTSNLGEFRKWIRNYKALGYLNPGIIGELTGLLIDEIEGYLRGLPEGLTTNQKFYIYLFEEVFRKYFGPEIIVQRRLLNNRSPFLSFRLIEEILKTELAGANSSFMEENPFNRYHGQVLYAHILKKTFPQLLDQPLDRGYCPRDFLEILGPLKITAGHIKRKFFVNMDKNTPGYSTLPYELNLPFFRKFDFDPDLFNKQYFFKQMDSGWENDQMNFSNLLSAVAYDNILKGKTYHV